jgi:hypothetical protein
MKTEQINSTIEEFEEPIEGVQSFLQIITNSAQFKQVPSELGLRASRLKDQLQSLIEDFASIDD